MAGPPLGRSWHVYRDSYAQERAGRQARERERPWTTARTGFWVTLGLAYALNVVDAVVDLDGVATEALRYAVAGAWLLFAVWYQAEVASRRKARRADDLT